MLERIGIQTLSSILKKAGHQTDVVRTAVQDTVQKMRDYQPDVLCYTITTGEHKYFIELNRELKKQFKFFSIFGGIHATFMPEMIEEEGVDSVCRGEGDDAILELVTALEQGKPYHDIKNMWFRQSDGTAIKNEMRPLIKDLDRLPAPDRDLLTKDDPILKNYKTRIFFIGRGCPYLCTYCFNDGYNKIMEGKGDVVRMRSVDSVVKEVKDVYEKEKIEFAHFFDDTFPLAGKEWLNEFAERLPKEVGIPFMCNVRANLVDDDLARILKKAGCFSVWMGVETANDEVRTNLLKRDLTKESMLNASRILRKHGIKVVCQNILGLPVNNPLELDLETLKFNMEMKPTFGWSSIFYPYPQTALYDYSIQHGFFDPNNFDLESNKVTSPLNFDEKTKSKIVNLHKLFGVTVTFPFLYPLTRILIHLPLIRLYSVIFFGWYGFMLHFVVRPTPINFHTVVDAIKAFFKFFGGLGDFNRKVGRKVDKQTQDFSTLQTKTTRKKLAATAN